MAERVRLFDGRKFMWDGVDYETEDEARLAGEAYAGDDFDVQVWSEAGKAFVYTRREVKEAAIEGS